MRAIVYHGVGDVRTEDMPCPTPRPGELLLRVATTGVCGSDAREYSEEPLFLPIAQRHPHSGHLGPTIPGHEFAGSVVDMADDVRGFAVGDLVAVGAGVSCGSCDACQSGITNMCRNYWTVGLHSHGGLAEYAAVPASCSLNVTESNLAPDLAGLCQPMSIAVHATHRGRVTEADRVIVLGAGGIGSFITFAASSAGADVTVIDLKSDKLAVARTLGATRVYEAGYPDLDRVVTDWNPTVVFECTARPEPLQKAVSVVGENGRVVVVGHQPARVGIDFKLISMGEREMIGTMAHVFARDLPRAVELIASEPDAWVSVAPVVYPLEDVVSAGLQPMATDNASQIKYLFDPSISSPRPIRVNA